MEKDIKRNSSPAAAPAPDKDFPAEWHGLPSARFRKYRSWINKQHPGICGTYCAAVMVHDAVYQKTKKALNKNTLLNGMEKVVDRLLPYRGTFFWDLAYGLRKILGSLPYWKVKTALIPDKAVVKILSGENPVPVIVGTTLFLNSPYKNHWLLVYAYGYNSQGKLFFKAYDNHGRYDAVVPASQTFSCVWLEEKEKNGKEVYCS